MSCPYNQIMLPVGHGTAVSANSAVYDEVNRYTDRVGQPVRDGIYPVPTTDNPGSRAEVLTYPNPPVGTRGGISARSMLSALPDAPAATVTGSVIVTRSMKHRLSLTASQ